jgi:chromosome segregation ATPase
LVDLRKELATMRDFKKDMQARVMEEIRLARLIEEVGKNLDDLRINEEEQSRTYRLIEDGRRQDVKRLTDLQGELTALRKRADEHRGRIDITDTSLRKLETRLNELLISERERSDSQAAFQEKQALLAVERDSIWKDWQIRFETIEKQSVDIENQLQSLDAAHLNIKRTQETVDDLIQRVERRINEVAEIQRLVEERFRQEWTTFKADDQKRWTNYTLSQDEQRSEFGRRFERINERVTYMEDGLQEIQDLLQYVNELNASNLQSLLSALSEFVAGYERTKGATR